VTGTRPKLSWSDLPGARVGVWGLGREGLANVRKLGAMGIEPVLVDDHPQAVAISGMPVLAAGYGGLAALEKCDVVVKSPGISRYRPEVARLEERGVAVAGGLGLWLQEADPARVLLITGTKGKSTIAAVTGHLLNGLGHRGLVGGNIGQPPWDPEGPPGPPASPTSPGHPTSSASASPGGLTSSASPASSASPGGEGPWDFWVIEVSSYQAMDLPCSPPVVAVTSLHPDHLDWHGGVENYYRDKLSVTSQPGADLTIANGDSDLLRERVSLLGPRVDWVHAADDPDASWMEPLGLLGGHNRRNALIARRCLQALGVTGASDAGALRAAARGFRHLDHRLQVIGDIAGVTFVDDSLSTNVLPTLAALDAFPGRRVALIAGGHDRGIDYAPLAVGLRGRTPATLVLTLPDSGPRIRAECGRAGLTSAEDHPDLDAAVARGFDWARPDGVVLLSPAAPSFGHFRDYRERGEAFTRAMRACAATVPD